jgi:hypothetical protein
MAAWIVDLFRAFSDCGGEIESRHRQACGVQLIFQVGVRVTGSSAQAILGSARASGSTHRLTHPWRSPAAAFIRALACEGERAQAPRLQGRLAHVVLDNPRAPSVLRRARGRNPRSATRCPVEAGGGGCPSRIRVAARPIARGKSPSSRWGDEGGLPRINPSAFARTTSCPHKNQSLCVCQDYILPPLVLYPGSGLLIRPTWRRSDGSTMEAHHFSMELVVVTESQDLDGQSGRHLIVPPADPLAKWSNPCLARPDSAPSFQALAL